MLIDEAKKIIADTETLLDEIGRLPIPIERMLEALNRYITATRKRLDAHNAKRPIRATRQVCKHMQLQDYYASDCAKCRGKAIICSNPEIIEIHGNAARDIAIEMKQASFPVHMSENRCRPESCKFFESEQAE